MHTAEETAPGGSTRLGWRDQVHDTLGGCPWTMLFSRLLSLP